MKKSIFITVALFAFTSITNQLLAQETDALKTRTKSNQTNERTAGYDLKKAVKFRMNQTDTGCSLAFEYEVKSPRDAASGQASGKRGYEYYKAQSAYNVSALDNSVTEVKSPRDVATGQASGKRQHKPVAIIKEYDKSSPKLAKSVSSSDAPSSGIAIDEPGVQSKVNVQDISFTKRCAGKTTKLSCSDGECEVPTDDCPNGDCTLICSWSWGLSQSGSSSTGGSAGSGRCTLEFVLQIEDGVCTAMAINEKGLPGDKKPSKSNK